VRPFSRGAQSLSAIATRPLLLIAVFLQLTGANPAALFASWIYRSSHVLLQPFRSLYPTEKIYSGQSELNLSLVFAILMYGLFAVVVDTAVTWFDRWTRRVRAGELPFTVP
jgi:YGGT family